MSTYPAEPARLPVHVAAPPPLRAVGVKSLGNKYGGLCYDGLNEAGLSGGYLWDTCESVCLLLGFRVEDFQPRQRAGQRTATAALAAARCLTSGRPPRLARRCVHLPRFSLRAPCDTAVWPALRKPVCWLTATPKTIPAFSQPTRATLTSRRLSCSPVSCLHSPAVLVVTARVVNYGGRPGGSTARGAGGSSALMCVHS